MNENQEREKTIFCEALDLAPDERGPYLLTACGGDIGLQQRIERLLARLDRSDRVLPANKEEMEMGEKPGTVIGRYKLLEQIGEGGFGVVYLAEQQEPVRRQVAFKIIKPGMDTRQVIARFEAERQALALMDHPHIAKVLDGGVVGTKSEIRNQKSEIQTGRPYFVMELVRGIPITRFCEENRLSIKDRLELFIPVCHAIQHAHQKGVIHRDIKPSNVLVTLDNGVPHPMVIDFGVAKAIHQRLTEKTLHTRFAQMIGTPAYMSPEQAEMSKQDVDTRTDVYSLGILLYELLTGTTPFPEERLRTASYAEIQRIISEEEPARPSTAVTRLNGRLRSIALNRRCEPAAFIKLIRGDLDWIVLKAIDKDRNRRYATPNELAADLERHLTNEPVLAAAPSGLYRFKKFVLRNRVAVAIGIILFLGALTSTWQAIRATQSESLALAAQSDAQAALRFVEDLLNQANPSLASPNTPRGRNIRLLSAIQTAAYGIEERYRNQPQVEAHIRLLLGNALRTLGEFKAAEGHLRASFGLYEGELGRWHPRTLAAAQAIAWLLIDQVKLEGAIALSQELIEVRQRELGPDDPLTLEAMNCLGHAYRRGSQNLEALAIFDEVIQRSQHAASSDPLTVLTALSGMSWVHYQMGSFAEHAALDRDIYETSRSTLGPDHPLTLHAMCRVHNNLRLRDRAFKESEQLALEARARCLRVLGIDHPTTISVESELALLSGAKGLNPIPRQRDLVESCRTVLGPDDPTTLNEQLRYGHWLAWDGFLEDGARLQLDAMNRIHRAEGSDTLLGGRAMRWLSGVYLAQGRFDEAESLRERVVEASRRLSGEAATWTHFQTFQLGNVYARQAKWDIAARKYQSFLPSAPEDYVVDGSMKPGVAWTAHCAGLLAARLADNLDGVREVANLALDRFGATENVDAAYSVARTLLVLPDAAPDMGKVLRLAERAVELLEDPLKQGLLAGLVAYRQGDWINAMKHLEPLAAPAPQEEHWAFAGNPDGRVASLAGFFAAMAHEQEGRTATARDRLSAATERLERILRCGDLGNTTTYPDGEWIPYAVAMVARDEAETLIYGERMSPDIDTAYLAAARRNWKPLQDMIGQVNRQARSREWMKARDGLLRVIESDLFDWEAAAHHFDGMVAKAAALFVLTKNLENYERLCRKVLSRAAVSQTEYAILPLLSVDGAPPELVHKALEMARWKEQQSGATPESKPSRHWRHLILGLAEYRCDNDEAAQKALTDAREVFNLNCSGTAHAYSALLAHRAGLTEEAAEFLATARSQFQQILQSYPEGLGRNWDQVAIFEIALQEAEQTLERETALIRDASQMETALVRHN
jgi:eukaryotic-like serine/threonine-protein kinase